VGVIISYLLELLSLITKQFLPGDSLYLKITIPSPNAAIFDFDGTLAKINIDFAMMKSKVISLSLSYDIQIKDIEHLYILELIDAGQSFLASADVEKADRYFTEAHKLISSIETEAAAEGILFEGTRELLQSLKKRNIKVGVITRNCHTAVIRMFPDILDYCDAFISREFTNRVKPHPEHIRVIMEIIEASPKNSIMVGDHPIDIKTGKNAGLFTVGVLTGNSSEHDLMKAGADMIIDSASDLLMIIPE
jgi:phosphoglycolate phosphatase